MSVQIRYNDSKDNRSEVIAVPPKYQKIADDLRIHIEAGKYARSTTLPTEFSIAQEYQVSRQTVRQALSMLAKDGLIEKRQGSGSHICRDVRQPESPDQSAPPRSIAVVTTYISDYIFPSILREVETVLSRNNCTPLLFATQNQVSNERKVLQTLLGLDRLDGVLVEGTKTCLHNPNLDLYRKLIDQGVPLVFFHGNYPELTGTLSVLDDNYGGGRALVDYLYKKGHRDIAGIFKSDDMQGQQRYAGYADALRDLELPVEDRRIFWYSTEDKDHLQPGSSSMEHLARTISGCTAVVCYNDEIANRLVSHLTKNGLSIPEDMAVVSFDSSQYSELSARRITSLSHGSYNVGRMAAEILIRLLQGRECHSEVAPWVLMEKESS